MRCLYVLISSLYGLTHHLISQTQYTMLVTVVIGSTVIPTLIAHAFFRPAIIEDLRYGPASPAIHAAGGGGEDDQVQSTGT